MIIKTTTERLITWIGIAIFAQFVLTSIHHVYGGLVYEGSSRALMPILFGIELLITLGLLFWYRQTRGKVALILLSIVTVLAYIVQGLQHSLYSHTYKDILFLAGVPLGTVQQVFRPLMPGEFVYPPTDVFFELTGVLELITIYLIAILTYFLIRDRQTGYQESTISLSMIGMAGLSIATVMVGVSLLFAYIATDRGDVLFLSLLMTGLGVLAIAVLIRKFASRTVNQPGRVHESKVAAKTE